MSAIVRIRHFTDPACPFAFSAEPALAALRHHYGDQLEWSTHFVVLSESQGEYEARGFSLEMVQAGDVSLWSRFGMPINSDRRPRFLIALPADTAVKAVQLNDPARADAFLRALRVAWMSDHRLIDEEAEQLAVAEECGIDGDALKSWIADPATAAAIEADKRDARSPIPAATGPLDYKLGGPPEERRYTCPSLEISRVDAPDRRFAAPGIQNLLSYEVLLANVAPELERAPSAEDPLEVLRSVAWPLTTVEVAEVMGTDAAKAEKALAAAGAVHQPNGYWAAP